MGFRIGVDVGGSFTDFAVLNEENGELSTLKVFSRPDAPGEEIVSALARMQTQGELTPSEVIRFTHGTTVGINTIIQRNGPKLALFTTKNFEDVLEIARLKIPEIHNLYSKRPEPLIPREHVFGIDERVKADGTVLKHAERNEVENAVRMTKEAGLQGIVVAFLHAYRNADNEAAVADFVRDIAPDMSVTTTSGTWPIIREYERTLTAAISGYVRPRVSHYLDRFEQTLRQHGVHVPPLITKCNGGVMGLPQARREPVQMLLSGTASGVIGAGHICKACGYMDVLTLDIGGTSADVAVLMSGHAQHGTGETVGDFSIHIPSVSVSSVGQGGGSIAWVDDLGILHVGPESAGSTPGPACYGRGGVQATITDAMVAQNLIGHGELGYGAVTVNREAARQAVKPLAEKLCASIEDTSASILEIAISAMYAEIQSLVSRFGIDQRTFQILAFGGAGPMLACFLARELDVAGVIVPPAPGVVSALGGLAADLRNDFIKTLFLDLDAASVSRLPAALSEMEKTGYQWLKDHGFTGEAHFTVSADMRYLGQSYEIETALDKRAAAQGNLKAIALAFHAEHKRLYGHCSEDTPIQLINLRLVVTGALSKPGMPEREPASKPLSPVHRLTAYFDGKPHKCPVYSRVSLAPDHIFDGPAIVIQDDTTTVVPPDFTASVDRFGNLLLTQRLTE